MGSKRSKADELLLADCNRALQLADMSSSPSFQTNVIFAINEVINLLNPDLSPEHLRYVDLILGKVPKIENLTQLLKLVRLGPTECLQYLKAPTEPAKKFSSKEKFLFEDLPEDNFLYRFMEWGRNSRAPLGFYFWTGVSVLSACCHRKLFTAELGYPLWMHQYIVLAIERGMGKGQASRPAIELLEHVNTKLDIAYEVTADNKEPDFSILARKIEFIPEDSTPEAIIKRLRKRQEKYYEQAGTKVKEKTPDGSGYFYLDEMATFFGRDKHASSNRPVLLTSLKEQRNYSKDTAGDGEVLIENVALSMLCNVAPAWFKKTIDREMLANGFMDRCTWVYRDPDWSAMKESGPIYPHDPLVKDELADWLINNVLCFMRPTHIDFTDEAKKIFESHRLELVRHAEEDWANYRQDTATYSSSRHQDICAQLACMLALGDRKYGTSLFEPIEVKGRHAKLAMRIVKEELSGLDSLFEIANRSDYHTAEVDILKFIKQSGGCAPRPDIYNKFKSKAPGKDKNGVQTLGENLMAEELIEQVEKRLPGKKGRPAQFWRTIEHAQAGGCRECVHGS